MILLTLLSTLIGWTYFLCWTISLYPPIVLNHRLRSVEGMAFDFVYLNAVGYATYTISICLLYFSPVVRYQYAMRHTDPSSGSKDLNYPLVQLNDVAYGANGSLLIAYMFYQMYWAGYSRGNQKESLSVQYLFIFGACAGFLLGLYSVSSSSVELLDAALLLGNVKVALSAAKYFPQIQYNRKRQSTRGFAINSVLLDIVGGVLSLLQLVLDAYIHYDFGGILNNPVKLTLSIVTLFFNSILCVQHYVLYPGREPVDSGQVELNRFC